MAEPAAAAHHQPSSRITTSNMAPSKVPIPTQSPLSQSHELGGAMPENSSYPTSFSPPSQNAQQQQIQTQQQQQSPFAKSWPHFVAGGLGGMTAAVLTAPLDVLKTRLQSDFYQAQLRAAREAATTTATGQHARLGPLRSMRYHLAETVQILRDVHRLEGARALFKGLGPNLVGVVPARSIHFYVYGTGKRAYSAWTGWDPANPAVHLASAVTAGIATSTATNPIWLVKTRLQLDKNDAERKGDVGRRQYRNSWDCIRQVMRNEGPGAFFKGMSASYLGVTESTLQWMMYEELKSRLRLREERIVLSGRERTWWDHTVSWTGNFFGAGAAKGLAAVLTYPHEVARTRLRQAPLADGKPKYTGLIHCFKVVWKEEGFIGLYGGLTPHLMRTIPSAAIMFAIYEGTLKLFSTRS